MFWLGRQHTQNMKFTILQQKIVQGDFPEYYVYIKTPNGQYGWYRLDPVETPEEPICEERNS